MKVGEAPPYKVLKADSISSTSKDPQRERGYDPNSQPNEQDDTDERRPKTGLGDNIDYLA